MKRSKPNSSSHTIQMSQRNTWEKVLGCKPYICPTCKRDKGMIYLFPDNSLRYVCFCGANISLDWINRKYNFHKKSFLEKSIQRKDSIFELKEKTMGDAKPNL